MSGFVLAASASGPPPEPRLLDRLRAHLIFRGPDGSAVWSDDRIGMAAAILRSVEDTREEQPLVLDGAVIVGDVRLDDRAGVLDALRACGRLPDSSCADLALALHAFHAWGRSCVDHLRGDFAFAIWMPRRKSIFAARDHFGVASLFYAMGERTLLAGNTLQAILAHPDVPDDLDETGVGDVLLFGHHIDRAATIYQAVRRLPPAHALEWIIGPEGRARLDIWQYWSLRGDVDARPRGAAHYVEAFRGLLRASVTDRLRADRVATHLSGGLDSSSVTATATAVLRATGRPFALRAYTIEYVRLFADQEGAYAQQVSDQLGIERESLGAEEFIERAPQETPAFLPPEPGTLLDVLAEVEIERRAATFSRVLLQGFGGDPALYPSRTHWNERMRHGQFAAIARDLCESRKLGVRPPLYLGSSLWRRRASGADVPAAPSGFAPDFAARVALASRFQAVMAHSMRANQRRGLATEPLWPHIFSWSDPSFTGIPIRSRFPFFDVRLAEFLLTVPPVPWFVNKTLLREAMRGMLPEAVRRRPKTALGSPPGVAAVQRTHMQWRLDLARLPELGAYVDLAWLARALREPPAALTDYGLAERAIRLAYWLRHRAPNAGLR